MTGMRKIGQIRSVEERLAKMGLMMAYPQHNYYDKSDVISLIPANPEALPIYSRDAEIFVGTLEDCENWLNGVDWARKYDKLLGISTESKRERKEQDRRNQNLLNTIKNSDKAKVK